MRDYVIPHFVPTISQGCQGPCTVPARSRQAGPDRPQPPPSTVSRAQTARASDARTLHERTHARPRTPTSSRVRKARHNSTVDISLSRSRSPRDLDDAPRAPRPSYPSARRQHPPTLRSRTERKRRSREGNEAECMGDAALPRGRCRTRTTPLLSSRPSCPSPSCPQCAARGWRTFAT